MRTRTAEPFIGTATVRREAAGRGFRIREIAYAPCQRQPLHAHDFDGITLVIGGAIRETVGRHEEIATCLSIVVKPAGVVHADDVGPRGARTVQILLDSEVEGLGPWRWMHAGAGVSGFLALRRLLSADGEEGLEDRVLDLLGEVTSTAATARSDPPGWLQNVKEALDDTLSANPPVRDLAREADVHPVSLARAFRRHYGTTVTEYRRRQRVRRAARAIERSDCHLTRIAYATGFSDHSHMCREVRAATGLTPTELQELARPS
ncbi:MAG: helix-turn-helix domain-containing protein [Gemmatimonadota bacterium]